MCETFPPNQQEDCNIPRASIKVGWENRLRRRSCGAVRLWGNSLSENATPMVLTEREIAHH
jgi:hypothetical protein